MPKSTMSWKRCFLIGKDGRSRIFMVPPKEAKISGEEVGMHPHEGINSRPAVCSMPTGPVMSRAKVTGTYARSMSGNKMSSSCWLFVEAVIMLNVYSVLNHFTLPHE